LLLAGAAAGADVAFAVAAAATVGAEAEAALGGAGEGEGEGEAEDCGGILGKGLEGLANVCIWVIFPPVGVPTVAILATEEASSGTF